MTEPADLQPELDAQPAPAGHERPAGVDDLTVAAVGRLTDAMETAIRARGHLYALHQLTRRADHRLNDAVELLRQAGHHDLADRITTELIGRNVIPGHWTFRIIEEYDDHYYGPFAELEKLAATSSPAASTT